MIYYLLTALLYVFYAYVPFMGLNVKNSLILCAALSATGGLLWGLIQVNTQLQHMSKAGLIFDLIITLCFFSVPFIVHKQAITTTGLIGVGLIIAGILFIKL